MQAINSSKLCPLISEIPEPCTIDFIPSIKYNNTVVQIFSLNHTNELFSVVTVTTGSCKTNIEVSYQITRNDDRKSFRIDSKSGKIYLKKPLKKPVKYSIEVEAKSNSINISRCAIIHFITNYGEQQPQISVDFNKTSRIMSCRSCYGTERTIRYFIFGLTKNCINIHPNTGAILVNFNARFCDENLLPEIRTELVNRNGVLLAYRDILLTPVSDFIKIKMKYIFDIPENSFPNTKIGKVNSSCRINPFQLPVFIIYDSISNELLTSQVNIDYENSTASSAMIIESENCIIYISIVNQNDNKPEFFQGIYRVVIMENKVQGNIIQVKAYDADGDYLNPLQYSITNKSGQFTIDTYNGWISSNRTFDREMVNQHNLTVTVSDGKFQSTAKVIVNIEDGNDEQPKWRTVISKWNNQSFVLCRQRNSAGDENDTLLRVDATDKDQTSHINSQITYKLSPINNHFVWNIIAQRIIYINHTTGFIKLHNDWVKYSSHLPNNVTLIYSITAQDHGFPRLYSTTGFIFLILIDKRDDLVIFTKTKSQPIAVLQSSPPGMLVVKILTKREFIGKLQFAIYYNETNEKLLPFAIDKNSGVIVCRRALMLMHTHLTYFIKVRACLAPKYHKTWCSEYLPLTIQITGYNMFVPRIICNPNIARIPENTQKGYVISRINIVDEDVPGLISETRLKILPKYSNNFRLVKDKNNKTLYEIHLAKSLDRETFGLEIRLILIAHDLGQPRLTSPATQLTIILEDIDDNLPYFIRPYYFMNSTANFIKYNDKDSDIKHTKYSLIKSSNNSLLIEIDDNLKGIQYPIGGFKSIMIFPKSNYKEKSNENFKCPYPNEIKWAVILKPISSSRNFYSFYSILKVGKIDKNTGILELVKRDFDYYVYVAIYEQSKFLKLCKIFVKHQQHFSIPRKFHFQPNSNTFSLNLSTKVFKYTLAKIIDAKYSFKVISSQFNPMKIEESTRKLIWDANRIPYITSGQLKLVILGFINSSLVISENIFINLYSDLEDDVFPKLFEVREGAKKGLTIGQIISTDPVSYIGNNITITGNGLIKVNKGQIQRSSILLKLTDKIHLKVVDIEKRILKSRFAVVHWLYYKTEDFTQSLSILPLDRAGNLLRSSHRCAGLNNANFLITRDCELYPLKFTSISQNLTIEQHNGRNLAVKSIYSIKSRSVDPQNQSYAVVNLFELDTSLKSRGLIARLKSGQFLMNLNEIEPTIKYEIDPVLNKDHGCSTTCSPGSTKHCTSGIRYMSESFVHETAYLIVIVPLVDFTVQCQCNSGFTGEFCEYSNDLLCTDSNKQCTNKTIQNKSKLLPNCENNRYKCEPQGKCIEESTNINGNGYHCECPLSWSGSPRGTCNRPHNPCAIDRLCTTGTCLPRIGTGRSHKCSCTPDYWGDKCDKQSLGINWDTRLHYQLDQSVALVSVQLEFAGKCLMSQYCPIIQLGHLLTLYYSSSNLNGRRHIYVQIGRTDYQSNSIELPTESFSLDSYIKLTFQLNSNAIKLLVDNSVSGSSDDDVAMATDSNVFTDPYITSTKLQTQLAIDTLQLGNIQLVPDQVEANSRSYGRFVGCFRRIDIRPIDISTNKSVSYNMKPYKLNPNGCSRTTINPCKTQSQCLSPDQCSDEWSHLRCKCPSGFSPPLCSAGYPAFRVSPNSAIRLQTRFNWHYNYQTNPTSSHSTPISIISMYILTSQQNALIFLSISSESCFTLLEIRFGLLTLIQQQDAESKPVVLTHKLARHLTKVSKAHHIGLFVGTTGGTDSMPDYIAISVDNVIAESKQYISQPGKSLHNPLDLTTVRSIYILGVTRQLSHGISLINYPLPPDFVGCVSRVMLSNESVPMVNNSLMERFSVEISGQVEVSTNGSCLSNACQVHDNNDKDYASKRGTDNICSRELVCRELRGDKPHEVWGQKICEKIAMSQNLHTILAPIIVGTVICLSILVLVVVMLLKQNSKSLYNHMLHRSTSRTIKRANKAKLSDQFAGIPLAGALMLESQGQAQHIHQMQQQHKFMQGLGVNGDAINISQCWPSSSSGYGAVEGSSIGQLKSRISSSDHSSGSNTTNIKVAQQQQHHPDLLRYLDNSASSSSTTSAGGSAGINLSHPQMRFLIHSNNNNNNKSNSMVNTNISGIQSYSQNPMLMHQIPHQTIHHPVFTCSHPDLYEDILSNEMEISAHYFPNENIFHLPSTQSKLNNNFLTKIPPKCFTPSVTDDATLVSSYYCSHPPIKLPPNKSLFTPTQSSSSNSSKSSSSSIGSSAHWSNNNTSVTPWLQLQRVLPPPPSDLPIPEDQYDYANHNE